MHNRQLAASLDDQLKRARKCRKSNDAQAGIKRRKLKHLQHLKHKVQMEKNKVLGNYTYARKPSRQNNNWHNSRADLQMQMAKAGGGPATGGGLVTGADTISGGALSHNNSNRNTKSHSTDTTLTQSQPMGVLGPGTQGGSECEKVDGVHVDEVLGVGSCDSGDTEIVYLISSALNDSASTAHIICGKDRHAAYNVRPVDATINMMKGQVQVTEQADIRLGSLVVKGAYIIESATRSIVSLSRLNLDEGYEYYQGREGAVLLHPNDSEMHIELVPEVVAGAIMYSYPQGNANSRLAMLEVYAKVNDAKRVLRARAKLRHIEHCREAHDPKDPECETCIMSDMTKTASKTSTTEQPVRGMEHGLSVGVDFMGPYTKSVGGNVWLMNVTEVRGYSD